MRKCMWTQRDQVSNSQIPVSDQTLIKAQYEQRTANHKYSERSKAPLRNPMPEAVVKVGDLVYLWADTRAQDRYLVTSEEGT